MTDEEADRLRRQARRLNSQYLGIHSLSSLNYACHISERFRFVYVAIPKAGCSTIKATLIALETDNRVLVTSQEAVHVRSFALT